jgi:hypothetical protein
MSDPYRDIDAINISTLKEVRKSPAHYLYRLANPREDETGLMLGRLNHAMILEPETVERDFAVFQGKTRRGKVWDAFEAEHLAAGRTIVKEGEYRACLGVRDAVLAHPIASQYLAAGPVEEVLTWMDAETGLRCKARLDKRSTSVGAIVDLKGTTSTDARIFGAVAARMGYHLQGAFYRRGARANGLGDLPFVIIAVEVDEPHDVTVYSIDEDAMYAGDDEVGELLARVAACRASGRWPGRYEGEQVLRLPSWAIPLDEEDTSNLDVEWPAAKGG